MDVSGGGGSLSAANALSTALFGNGLLQVGHTQYSFAVDGGGAPGLITPVNNASLPANSIVYGCLIDWTTPGVGIGNTTSIGLTGTGGGAAVLKAATAVASLTGFLASLSTFAAPIKITTAGTVTLTTAVAALTAGICEIYIFYVVSPT